MPFCENLCRLKNERGETNYRLAKAIGVSEMSIANWCSGKHKPLAIYIEKLADHYGVTVEELRRP